MPKEYDHILDATATTAKYPSGSLNYSVFIEDSELQTIPIGLLMASAVVIEELN